MSIAVYKIEYEIRRSKTDYTTWTAHIAAYSIEEAVRYLRQTVGNNINVTAQGHECRLDAISDEIRQKIVDSAKRPVGRPPKKK